jgi:hypothetical protein
MEMFNDLRGIREIRDHFQFWFYLYPTGQPFLLTAQQLHHDLQQACAVLDPNHATPALNEMVLVGHSMGGLIARLQTLDGLAELEESSQQALHLSNDASGLYQLVSGAIRFQPNRSVQRVVTIASPNRGSPLANSAAQWIGRRVIRVPRMILRTLQTVDGRQQIETSIDALSPASPTLELMHRVPTAPFVQLHNIIGRVADGAVLSKFAGEGDGVVTIESARLDDAISELIVESDHINIHRHPRTVLEVRRILLEHLEARQTVASSGANT